MRSLLLVPLLFVLGLPVAAAEDEVDPAVTLLASLTELRKAEDVAGLVELVAEVPEVYKASENKSAKGKILGELGKIVKDDDLGAARRAAVEALVALENPKAAWKVLSKAMPGPKVEEASVFQISIVKAAGVLAQSRAVKPLTELAYKAKDKEVAAAAAEALGGYRDDKRGRTKILEELITIGKRTRPGRSTEKAVSKEAQERWATVGPRVIKGLNDLTGRSESSFEDWEALWHDYKKRPKELFVE